MSNRTQDRYGDDASSQQQVKHGKDSKTEEAVRGLIKSGFTNYQILQELKRKYSDAAMRDIIYDAYTQRLEHIKKRAMRFKDKLRFSTSAGTPEKRIARAKEYAARNHIDGDEMNVFIQYVFQDKSIETSFNSAPNTPIAKLLGITNNSVQVDPLEISATDLSVVNDIITLKNSTMELHSNVVLQSLTYRDCDLKAIYGANQHSFYKKSVYSHVHPVIAALFFPRIKSLDENMLIANFGNIIEAKQRGANVSTQPDFELYMNLVNDPTSYLCNETSAIQDIKHRFMIQTKLWENVLSLRQGIFYENNLTQLTALISACKNNLYDAPDHTFVNDEGTYLRRLLGAFGVRPTLISTRDMYSNAAPLGDNRGPTNILAATGVSSLTSIPMITVRLPLNYNNEQTEPLKIVDSMNQTQFFKEGLYILPKHQGVLHSRDVLFFYVSRRYQTISLARSNVPCSFSRLPSTVGGWEALNTQYVDFPCELSVFNDKYDLRSVVIIETNPLRKNLIIGCTAAVVIPDYQDNMWGNTLGKGVILYDPVGAGIQSFIQTEVQGQLATVPASNQPLTYIDYDTSMGNTECESLVSRAATRGTIFMYQRRPVATACEEGNQLGQPLNFI
jgi:hypothetical protein